MWSSVRYPSNWFLIGSTIVTDGGFFLFPLAYVIGDLLSEVVMASSVPPRDCGVLPARLLLLPHVSVDRAPARCELLHRPGGTCAGSGPGLADFAGSLLGYLFGQTPERLGHGGNEEGMQRPFPLWLRMIVSTLVGELLDTLIFWLHRGTGARH